MISIGKTEDNMDEMRVRHVGLKKRKTGISMDLDKFEGFGKSLENETQKQNVDENMPESGKRENNLLDSLCRRLIFLFNKSQLLIYEGRAEELQVLYNR